jgi:hypothetical protein
MHHLAWSAGCDGGDLALHSDGGDPPGGMRVDAAHACGLLG